MPLFGRADGALVRGESPLRRMIPYLMRRRNESLVFHAASYDVAAIRRWLAGHNRSGERHATLFEYFLWAAAQVMHARPRLNRFVSGGRIYQRRGVFLSFAAGAELPAGRSMVTVKLEFPADEPFPTCAGRIAEAVQAARAGRGPAERELALAAHLPGFVLRGVMAALRWCDRFNLLPGRLIARDPLYTSAFMANLGSLGLSNTWHHLYEYGTAGIFGVMGEVVGDTLTVNWTFDERAADGHECAIALKLVRELLERSPDVRSPAATGAAASATPADAITA